MNPISSFLNNHVTTNRTRSFPDDDASEEFTTQSQDGVEIAGWCCNASSTKGTLCYLHGFTGHCGTSDPFDAAFAMAKELGLGFVSHDSRHHGKSGDKLPTFGTAEMWDFQAVLAEAESRGFSKPFIAIGESLGALGAQRTAIVDSRISGAFLIHPPAWPMDALGVEVKLGTPFAAAGIIASYKWDILSDGDIRRHPSHPDHEPLVLFIMGDNDKYGWEKTRSVYDHWYLGEPEAEGTIPCEEPDAKKWFVKVPDAVHPNDHGGDYVWHWPDFPEMLRSFVTRCIDRHDKISTNDITMNTPKPNPAPTESAPNVNPETEKSDKWVMVWNDEFDGDKLDVSKWAREENGYGGGNNERQFYSTNTKYCYTKNSNLHISVYRDSYMTPDGKTQPYTSARIRTLHRAEWTYGRFEICAKVPSGQGIWPAVWMLPTESPYGTWASSGEIDILESRGDEVHETIGSLHFGGAWPRNTHLTSSHPFSDKNAAEDFHLYALEWDKDEISWFVDGVCYQTIKKEQWHSEEAPDRPSAPFDHPFHLIVNVAVDGMFFDGGNQSSDHIPDSEFPQTLLVDYVRVYERA